MDAARLRAAFPVLASKAYLNSGTCGPVPEAAVRAAQEAARLAADEGRSTAYFERSLDLRERLRAAYAGALGGDPADVALTTSTSEGIVRVLLGLGLGEGDEVLTAPDEHPGLLGPLIAARDQRGVVVRTAPFGELAEAVGPRTRLVACSHVSWVTGALAPAGLAGVDVPLLLDGAQGLGAVAVDPAALGCDFYAASGQKWLCGPVGTGSLWVSPTWRDRLEATGPTYMALEDPASGLDARLREGAARHDTPAQSLEAVAAALAAHDVLAEEGWDAVRSRAIGLAGVLAGRLVEAGEAVAPRGATTLVSWEAGEDPAGLVVRAAEAGVVIRNLPGTPYVRASVGAWNDEEDLDRLLAIVAG